MLPAITTTLDVYYKFLNAKGLDSSKEETNREIHEFKYRIILEFTMALPVLRICPRLLFCTLSKPVSCPHLIYSPIVNQQRLCSGFNDDKLDDNVDSFGEFEEISATDVLFTNVDIDAIVGDDLEKKKSLQVFISEMNMLMQTQQLVAPKQLTPEQWLKLLKLRHEASRLGYLKRLFFKEKRKELRSFLSEEKRVSREQFRESKKNIPRVPRSTNSPLTYELGQTALFHRIQKPVMKQKQNFNLALTMCFGPDLVVDCSYEKYMTPAELFGCARQILFLWSTNRGNTNPFNLIFCNLSPEAKIMEHLRFFFHKTEGDCSMLNFTEKSYTDLYRTEELVYLTPHCEEELEKYDGNSVYIIGT